MMTISSLLRLSPPLYPPPCAARRKSVHKGKRNLSLFLYRTQKTLNPTLAPTIWVVEASGVHFLDQKLRMEPRSVNFNSQ